MSSYLHGTDIDAAAVVHRLYDTYQQFQAQFFALSFFIVFEQRMVAFRVFLRDDSVADGWSVRVLRV